MKRKYSILLLGCLFSFSSSVFSQEGSSNTENPESAARLRVYIPPEGIGINTEDPETTLHIQEFDAANPTGIDGILIPRLTNFPAIDPPNAGNLIFLRKDGTSSASIASQPDGFYYWNGMEWVQLETKANLRTEYRNLYCAFGQGYLGNANSEDYREVILEHLVYDASKEEPGDIFSLSANTLTVGKSGTYLVSLSTSAKKDGTGLTNQQVNILGEVLINGAAVNPPIMAKGNTSIEYIAACSIMVNTVVELQKGDKISARVQQLERRNDILGNEPSAVPVYTNDGITSLSLTFLHN